MIDTTVIRIAKPGSAAAAADSDPGTATHAGPPEPSRIVAAASSFSAAGRSRRHCAIQAAWRDVGEAPRDDLGHRRDALGDALDELMAYNTRVRRVKQMIGAVEDEIVCVSSAAMVSGITSPWLHSTSVRFEESSTAAMRGRACCGSALSTTAV